jgi:RNA polymerase sigma-70 factor (ECF subfamily)
MPLENGGTVERDEILAKLRERIVRFAAFHLPGDAAEDVAQEVLMLLHEKYPHLDTPEDLVPLSFQILRFKMIAMRRKAARRGEYTQVSLDDLPLAGPDSSPDVLAERRELLERLAAAMGQLGERCRRLMRLKLAGKSFPEIRSLMGAATLNTVYTWDHRCRKQLLELMGGSWEPRP